VADRSVCVVDYLVKVLDRHKTVTTTSITHRPPFLLILPQQTHHITLGNCQVSWVLTSHTHTPKHTCTTQWSHHLTLGLLGPNITHDHIYA